VILGLIKNSKVSKDGVFGVKAKIYPEDDRVGQFAILLLVVLVYMAIHFIGAYTIKSRKMIIKV
jgi:hypothetical protein